ncbi:nuclear transport factor 2 family protein [Parasphingopyxis marina]|uniref:Nuclear transport factor 2 family protein n=1 Tax=Parasphingopyxis marina TaxID=2761622 RepID=A0A842HVH7_9SPHN|nr:nuclear transport factor 2 family protein [Parasphingopyxis marina]MBC2776381.1 nuclear transport factor 2 family protein [Parasphingopyxis marina]
MKAFTATLSLAALALALPAAPLAAQQRPNFDATSAETAPVGEAYFAAYIARDWDALEPLLADAASFRDPTAELVFGGALADGKAAMMTLFRQGYAGITRMEFRPLRTLHAGHYAIFEGELDWALDMGDGSGEGRIVESVMPFVTLLRIEDGLVVEHRDYADYAPFLAAARAARDAAG